MFADVKITQSDKFKAWTSLLILLLKNVLLVSVDIMTDIWSGINLLSGSAVIGGTLLLIFPFLPGLILTMTSIKDTIKGKENMKKIQLLQIIFPVYQLIENVKATLNILRGHDEEENEKLIMKLKFLEATLEAYPAFALQVYTIHIILTTNGFIVESLLPLVSASFSFVSVTTTILSYIKTDQKKLLLLIVTLLIVVATLLNVILFYCLDWMFQMFFRDKIAVAILINIALCPVSIIIFYLTLKCLKMCFKSIK